MHIKAKSIMVSFHLYTYYIYPRDSPLLLYLRWSPIILLFYFTHLDKGWKGKVVEIIDEWQKFRIKVLSKMYTKYNVFKPCIKKFVHPLSMSGINPTIHIHKKNKKKKSFYYDFYPKWLVLLVSTFFLSSFIYLFGMVLRLGHWKPFTNFLSSFLELLWKLFTFLFPTGFRFCLLLADQNSFSCTFVVVQFCIWMQSLLQDSWFFLQTGELSIKRSSKRRKMVLSMKILWKLINIWSRIFRLIRGFIFQSSLST